MCVLHEEQAALAAAQRACAEQHHQQVVIRALWEGLGAAVALRRAADQSALVHFQNSRQQQVWFTMWSSGQVCCLGSAWGLLHNLRRAVGHCSPSQAAPQGRQFSSLDDNVLNTIMSCMWVGCLPQQKPTIFKV